MNSLFKNDLEVKHQYPVISGTDEAGRGPLAGPLVVASVILKDDFHHEWLDDSKKISEKRREELFDIIINNCLEYTIQILSPAQIDHLNIFQATMLGMKETIEQLKIKPDCCLIDGNKAPKMSGVNLKPVVKGDGTHACIAAASILAKVTRDRIMLDLHEQYPEYGFAKHKGYPTKDHLSAIRKFGITSVHRKSYKPVMQMTLQDLL